MWATILSLFAGVLTKSVTGLISSWANTAHLRNLSTTSARHQTIQLLQRDYDKVDWSARITRIFIVLPIVWVFLALCVYIVIWKPELSYTIEVNRFMSPVWQFLLPFPINEKGFVEITGVFVIERIWIAVFYIVGYFLNKFGK